MYTQLKKSWNSQRGQQARHSFAEYVQALRSTLDKHLFEASTDFWNYQMVGVGSLLGLIIGIGILTYPDHLSGFHTMTTVIWGACFFLASLVLRQHYKNADWEAHTQTKILLRTIASCIFLGLCITAVMSGFFITFYFDELHQIAVHERSGTSSIRAAVNFFFGYWFVSAFYLLFWMMLYFGITSRRKTKQVEIDNLRLQNSLKEAELSSLSNQLNPHFLFNALNNIRFMIHEDANNAEKMLMSLSSVLRYSLDSSKNEKVPFKDELEISKRYIDLIRIQFEERLEFSLDIPTPLLDCQLPPMVLQMLLENAVKHGIDNIREGGTINVQATLVEQTMVIKVCNDLPEDYASKQKEPGIGLYNIGQRLDLLYSGQGSIETEVAENRFCVTVKIPQENV